MTFDVTVSGSDIVFPCEPDETVLDAAERAGFSIPTPAARACARPAKAA